MRKGRRPAVSSTLKKLGRRPNGPKKPRKTGAERLRDYWDIQRLNQKKDGTKKSNSKRKERELLRTTLGKGSASLGENVRIPPSPHPSTLKKEAPS